MPGDFRAFKARRHEEDEGYWQIELTPGYFRWLSWLHLVIIPLLITALGIVLGWRRYRLN